MLKITKLRKCDGFPRKNCKNVAFVYCCEEDLWLCKECGKQYGYETYETMEAEEWGEWVREEEKKGR